MGPEEKYRWAREICLLPPALPVAACRRRWQTGPHDTRLSQGGTATGFERKPSTKITSIHFLQRRAGRVTYFAFTREAVNRGGRRYSAGPGEGEGPAGGAAGTRGECGCGVGRRSSSGLAARAGLSEPPVSVRSANLAATRCVLRAGTGLPSGAGAGAAGSGGSAGAGSAGASRLPLLQRREAVSGCGDAGGRRAETYPCAEGRFFSVSRLCAKASAGSGGTGDGAVASRAGGSGVAAAAAEPRGGRSSTRSGVASTSRLRTHGS